jgi:hypothetical protein
MFQPSASQAGGIEESLDCVLCCEVSYVASIEQAVLSWAYARIEHHITEWATAFARTPSVLYLRATLSVAFPP